MDKSGVIKNVVIILLIIALFGTIIYFYKFPRVINIENNVCPDDKLALLDVQVTGLYENLYDSSEMFYDYNIYNYGKVEAKNVKILCQSFDKNDILQFSLSDNYGNVASGSWVVGEVVGKNKIVADAEYSSLCYVESCDDCKILYKNIPEIVDAIEKANS